jgi:hypothetical protein
MELWLLQQYRQCHRGSEGNARQSVKPAKNNQQKLKKGKVTFEFSSFCRCKFLEMACVWIEDAG